MRSRTRQQITLPRRTVDRLRRRVADAKAFGYPTSFSAEIERAVDEADGNLRSARHTIGNDLNLAAAAVALIKRELLLGRRIDPEDLRPIEDAIAKVIRRLEAVALPARVI